MEGPRSLYFSDGTKSQDRCLVWFARDVLKLKFRSIGVNHNHWPDRYRAWTIIGVLPQHRHVCVAVGQSNAMDFPVALIDWFTNPVIHKDLHVHACTEGTYAIPKQTIL